MDTHTRTRIIGEDGWQGQILRRVQSEDGTPYVVVAVDSGEQVMLPVSSLTHQPDGSFQVAVRREALAQAAHTGAEQAIAVPIIAEQLLVGKRAVETGRVRVQKVVHEREAVVDEPLLHEDVQVERVAINQPITAAPEMRQEGDTLIIPVVEEILVVEKRLILKEELRITRRQTTVRDPQTVTLQREDVIVEHLPPKENADRDPGSDIKQKDSPTG